MKTKNLDLWQPFRFCEKWNLDLERANRKLLVTPKVTENLSRARLPATVRDRWRTPFIEVREKQELLALKKTKKETKKKKKRKAENKNKNRPYIDWRNDVVLVLKDPCVDPLPEPKVRAPGSLPDQPVWPLTMSIALGSVHCNPSPQIRLLGSISALTPDFIFLNTRKIPKNFWKILKNQGIKKGIFIKNIFEIWH